MWRLKRSYCVQEPTGDHLTVHHARSLTDTLAHLDTSLQDAFAFVERTPHKRLWQLLANEALQKGEYALAIKAFVLQDDYKSVQFVKQVRCTRVRHAHCNLVTTVLASYRTLSPDCMRPQCARTHVSWAMECTAERLSA